MSKTPVRKNRVLEKENLDISKQVMEDIINSIPSGLFIFQYSPPDKLYLIKANSEAVKITGFDANEWIGREFNEIWPSASSSGVAQKYLDVIHTGNNIELENAIYNDERIRGAFRIRVFRIPGRKLGIAFEDISKVINAGKALKGSEELYQLLADHVSDAVWLMDINLNTTFHSPSATRLRGYTAEEIMNLPPDKHLTKESYKRAIELFLVEVEKARTDPGYNTVHKMELEFLRKDGSTFWADCTFTFIKGKNGKPDSILGEARDISERKTAEEKISRLLAEKEILLKEVHHRIKNNMNTIMSLLYMQAMSVDNSSTAATLTDASNRVRSMMLIYDKLYRTSDFREISAEVYLSELIECITTTLNSPASIRITSYIENCPLNTSLLYPAGIIVNELLTNAFKYAFPGRDEGEIVISLIKKGSFIEILFRDNGIGIPETVFKTEPRGFGINLVKILVGQISGEMDVKNTSGTEYRIVFPL